MKRFILFWLLIVASPLYAQFTVYFVNGNKFTAQTIESYQEGYFKMQVKRGESVIINTHHRDRIPLIVKGAAYLVVSSLNNLSDADATQQVNNFLNASVIAPKADLIIKALPTEVILANISTENDDIINYVNESGQSASISKNEIVAIIRKDGSHAILKEFVEAASLLGSVKNTVDQLANQPIPAPQPTPVPQPDPTPQPAPRPIPNPTPRPTPASTPKPSLTEGELEGYREKAKQKVDAFYGYLNVIVDKQRPKAEKDIAVETAARLFMPNSMIEVDSDKNPGQIKKYTVREYLKRLQLLPYSTAKIEWSEVQYIKDLTQEKDGNYYGIINGQQTFMGYGKENEVMYSDVRKKNVKVKLQSYEKQIDGQTAFNWDVLLGNIGLSVK
jgi:hypothetical protein